jgi:TolB-like protein
MRKTIIFATAVLFLLSLDARFSYCFENEIKSLSLAVSSAMDKVGSRKRLAVSDFTDPKGNVTELGKYIADELSEDLIRTARGFEVLERAEFASVLSRSGLAVTVPYNPDSIKKLGQEAKVGAVVTGSIMSFSKYIRVSLNLINTYQGKVAGSAAVDIPRTRRIDELLGASATVQAIDLTGLWSCDDGGTYYIRQIGNRIWWYGERSYQDPLWSNVARGEIMGSEMRLEWSDVPKGHIRGSGSMVLDIVSGNKIRAVKKTGGFGGAVWTR